MLVHFSGVQGFLVSEKKMVLLCSRPPGNVQFTKKSVIYVQSYCIAQKSTLFECQCIQHESANWGRYFYVS